jgi:hypothetical protein
MKTKGITIWEQYLERLVLGIAVLIFVALTALQFIGSPHSAEVKGKKVPPGEIDELVKEKAELLQGLIAEDAAARVELEDPEPVLDVFNELRTASISPEMQLDPLQYRVVILGEGDAPRPGEPFNVPAVPAPYEVTSRQYFDALSADFQPFLDEYEDLQAMVTELPHDMTWVTAYAKFDVGQVLESYRARGPEGEQPIPTNWFDGRVDILDLKVEREEYVDGQWVKRTLLEPIPGQVSYRAQLTAKIDAASRDRILKQLAEPGVQDDIVRPEFYPTLNASWAPAEDDDFEDGGLAEDEDPVLARLIKQLGSFRRQRIVVNEKLEELGGALSGDPGAGGRAGAGGGSGGAAGGSSGGGGDGIFGGGGSGGGRGGGGADPGQSSIDRRRRILTQRLAKLDEKILAIERRVAEIRGDGAEIVEADPAEAPPPDTLLVWAHDLSVEAGRRYRYRFTVELFNPFFARRISLVETQHDLADGLTSSSPTSEWSNPILAEPPLRAFVVRAAAPDVAGAIAGSQAHGTASVEVYRFHGGRWWLDTFRVQPGDRVGSVEAIGRRGEASQDVDFRTNWFVLDIVAAIDGDRQAEDRGWAASVLLQSLSLDGQIVRRDPRDDARNPLRYDLKSKVELAEAGEQVASAR